MTEVRLTNRGRMVAFIMQRYMIDGRSLTLEEAEDLLARLDTEADYLGAYVDD